MRKSSKLPWNVLRLREPYAVLCEIDPNNVHQAAVVRDGPMDQSLAPRIAARVASLDLATEVARRSALFLQKIDGHSQCRGGGASPNLGRVIKVQSVRAP